MIYCEMAKHNRNLRRKQTVPVRVKQTLVGLLLSTVVTNDCLGATGTGSLQSPGVTEYSTTIRVGITLQREKKLGTGTSSYVDMTLRVRDGVQGKNTKIEPLTCGTYDTFGQAWGTPTHRFLQKAGNGNSWVYRWDLPHKGVRGTPDGSGQVYCEYKVTVTNRSDPLVAAMLSNVYASDGLTRGGVKIFWVDVTYPDITSITSIGGGRGYPNDSTDVRAQWTPDGTVNRVNVNVVEQPVNATVTYEKNVQLRMGEEKDNVFSINGTGAQYVEWDWTYTGDTRLFDLIGPNGEVLEPSQQHTYSGPVSVRARQFSSEWGVKTGLITVNWNMQ